MALPNDKVVGYLQAMSYTAEQDRGVNAVLSQRGSNNLAHGIVFSDWNASATKNLRVLPNGGMSIKVGTGYAMVYGHSVSCPTETILTVQPSTAVARRDLVVLRVYDQEKGDAVSGAEVEIVKGTTTTDPAIPPNSLLIAQITVGANVPSIGTPDIIGRTQYTAAAGGTVVTSDLALSDEAQAQQVSLGSLLFDHRTYRTYQQWSAGAAGLTPFADTPFSRLISGPVDAAPHSIVNPYANWAHDGVSQQGRIAVEPYGSQCRVIGNTGWYAISVAWMGGGAYMNSGINYLSVEVGSPMNCAYRQTIFGMPEAVVAFECYLNNGQLITCLVQNDTDSIITGKWVLSARLHN